LNVERLADTIGNTISAFTWLFYDFLLLILTITLFLGYSDYDIEMQQMMRGMIALCFITFYTSSLHILIWIRVVNKDNEMSAFFSYGCHLIKAAAIGCFIWKYLF
jgi:hypothetical protein